MKIRKYYKNVAILRLAWLPVRLVMTAGLQGGGSIIIFVTRQVLNDVDIVYSVVMVLVLN